MKSVVILTKDQLRHDYLRMALGLATGIDVLRSYCEGREGTIIERSRTEGSEVKIEHLRSRARSEHDFFNHFVEQVPDRSNPVSIPKGTINESQCYEEIIDLDPEVLVTYGSSIVENPLLSAFEDRAVNAHLGLSPYYRGAGTNFWPLVNKEPELVGVTFHRLESEVDAGAILHQMRARIYPNDSPHQIGNRLIADMVPVLIEIVRRFDYIETIESPAEPEETNYYRIADFSEDAIAELYDNFEDGLIESYLSNREERIEGAPIARNPELDNKSNQLGRRWWET